MGPLRRLSNGRSPLVNKQSQITAFFTPNKSASTLSPSPSPSPGSIPLASPNPNPSPKSNPPSQQKKPLLVIGSGTTSSTPSPNSNPPSQKKKSLLVIGSATTRATPSPNSDSKSKAKSPESGKRLYGEEVVGKRVRVYWPLDETWYDGCVKSFDSLSGKHLIQYEDAEEEELEIEKEKIEWVEEEKKSFRRLKRKSVSEDVVVEEGGSVERKKFGRLQRNLAMEKDAFDEEEEEKVEKEGSGGDDDSEDEDWGKNVAKESVEDDSEDMDLEDEEEDEGVGSSRKARGTSSQSRKRKVSGDKTSSGKKSKGFGKMEKIATKNAEEVNGGKLVEPVNNVERHSPNFVSNALTGDVAERYTQREAEKLPFLGAERRDAKRRRPGDLDYDLRTLYLPSDFLKGLSGGQRQWWDFKSKHMDKVMFFKMGKFYELFEMDAHIGAKELDLQYMKGDQPHVGFPEKNFTTNVEKLARKGYRVLIIEQTETPEQLDIRRKEKGSKDKVVKREICGLITKGTLTEGEMLATNPDAFYLMAVTETFQVTENHKENVTFGVCLVDVSTSMFLLGQFTDDSERSSLCSLLSELRPVEIIKPAKVISPESEKVLLRHTRNPLVNELVPVSEFWNADKTIDEVRTIYMRLKNTSESGPSDKESFGASDSEGIEDYSDHLPNILSELVSAGESGSSALSALGGCLFYLRQSFLDETLLRCAKFELLPCSGFRDIPQKPYLVLDSAAIENLEIFENNRNGGSSGTLFTHLNHCVTAFGKRLLKNWIARPLYHAESIKERQDAVASLRGNVLAFVLDFRKELSRLPDMERLLARLFASSEGNGRNANKVVLYEDASKKQLKEFVTALRGCELLAGACSSFSAALDSVESGLLRHLLTPGQGLPDICSVLNHFKNAFDWTEADSSGRIIPRKGVDTEYDSACKAVKEVEANLARHLNEQRDLLGDESINYVTVGKDLYLLEVPESMQSKVPRDYELRSSKKGFFRYWTRQIKKLLGELSPAEAEKESKLKTILQRLIGRFCEHHIKWRQMISAAAELDVLMSLAIVSDYYEGPTCRPTIVNSPGSSEVPCLLAKSLGHPVLRSDTLGKGTFVPNDVTIGGSGNASFILLTGPNMGGKSTLLRQVCMAVILAQLGADVPAEYFELSPVDRIFVRMGARDHIMAGQSTFLTELSETASMLSSATCNSLVVLDELGRGTSTSDGQAIAESVLEHFVHKVNCRGMFSTHYHRLAVDYQEDPQVSLCHMACKVEKGTGYVEEVTFLYRLTQGACPKSYGVNVARLAGLPDSVLQKAAAKSREFESMYGKNKQGRKESSGHSLDKSLAIILQDLVNILSNSTCNKTCDGNGIGSLAEIHKRARLLMQGS